MPALPALRIVQDPLPAQERSADHPLLLQPAQRIHPGLFDAPGESTLS